MRCPKFDWRLLAYFIVLYQTFMIVYYLVVRDKTPLNMYHIGDNRSCTSLRYIPVNSQRDGIIALASYPGSGNTWLRHLLQQATGIITGSIYPTAAFRANGFPGRHHCSIPFTQLCNTVKIRIFTLYNIISNVQNDTLI